MQSYVTSGWNALIRVYQAWDSDTVWTCVLGCVPRQSACTCKSHLKLHDWEESREYDFTQKVQVGGKDEYVTRRERASLGAVVSSVVQRLQVRCEVHCTPRALTRVAAERPGLPSRS